MEMEDQGTDLGNVLNDQQPIAAPEPTVQSEPQPDPGVQQAEPPTATHQEPDHVPRAAVLDERRKRQEAERRAMELEQYIRQQQANAQQQAQQVRQPQGKQEQQGIDPSQFSSYEAYLEALADSKATTKAKEIFAAEMRRMQAEHAQATEQQQTASDLQDMFTAGSQKYADFQEVVGSPNVPITPVMMNTMLALDGGHEVAYHLGRNPAEAARIARLPPSTQAREVGKLAKQVAAPPSPPVAPSLPKTLTQTRSASGQFTTSKVWDGPTPLNSILGKQD